MHEELSFPRELGRILAWLAFPIVPVILADLHYQTSNPDHFDAGRIGPDPHDWSWDLWIIILGPLLGYGFLAGATMDLPDEPGTSRGRLRTLLARRAVWLSIGPWSGFLIGTMLYWGYALVVSRVPALQDAQFPESWRGTWSEAVLVWVAAVLTVGLLSYGWLWPAGAALRRGARLGRWPRALCRGLAVALGFLGSLFGSFWAVTSYWRSYFFDARLVPLLAVALGLACLSGCAGTITYGQMRRRDLFHAMLVAWVVGLALMWRWWSRPRSGRPHGPTTI
jgi:hypothetical protein